MGFIYDKPNGLCLKLETAIEVEWFPHLKYNQCNCSVLDLECPKAHALKALTPDGGTIGRGRNLKEVGAS